MDLERFNRRLAVHVADYTGNPRADRRVSSPILGMPRDLYIYLLPGYDSRRSYPPVVFLHMATFDERALLGARAPGDLDDMIVRGECPPFILAGLDGMFEGDRGTTPTDSAAERGPVRGADAGRRGDVPDAPRPFLRCGSVRPSDPLPLANPAAMI